MYKRFQYERAVYLFWFSTAYVTIFHSVQWLEVKCVIVRFVYIGGIMDQYRLNFLFMKYVWNYQCIHYKTNRQHAIYHWHLGHHKKNETHIRNWHEHRLIIIHFVYWAYNTNVLLNTLWRMLSFDWPVNWLGCTNRNCKQIYICHKIITSTASIFDIQKVEYQICTQLLLFLHSRWYVSKHFLRDMS
jgi:hypothetical protein